MVQNAQVAVRTAESFDYWIDEGARLRRHAPETVTRGILAQQQLCGYDILAVYHQVPRHAA